MVSNSPDRKRKRGRPPVASQPPKDASNRGAQDYNDADDGENESRPRKRGRKTEKQSTVLPSAPQVLNNPVGRKGRPPKQQEQRQRDASQGVIEHTRMTNKPLDASNEVSRSAQIQGKPASVAGGSVSSQPRRSGRERRSWNPDEVYGATRTSVSQNGSSPSQPRQRISKGLPESESPVSTSRRRDKEDSARGAGEASSSTGPADNGTTSAAQTAKKEKSRKRVRSTQEEADASEPGRPARHGAQSKKRHQQPSLDVQDHGQENASRPRKTRYRKSKTKLQIPVSDGSGDRPATRRGRPKASGPNTEILDTSGPSESRGPEHESDRKATKKPKQKKEATSAPRRDEVYAEAEVEASGSSEDESELPFRHLQEITQNVPRSTVASKWNRLDVPSISVVSSFLADAQRPVLFRLQNTNRRREHASAAMGVVTRRLRAKLMKGFPFPAPIVGTSARTKSGSYEDEFDFERTVDAMQNLENSLNPLLHSVHLLEKEIKKQEDALAKDYQSLHRLENNARSKTKEWREKAKREHALAPGVQRKDQGLHRELDDKLELGPPVEDGPFGGLSTNPQDEELTMLSRQIGSHMESLRGNLQQIGGVVPAIAKSKAALQQMLLKHLDEEQYVSVLLG